MSLLHSMVFKSMLKATKEYDPGIKLDYAQIRANEEKSMSGIKIPRGVSLEYINLNGIPAEEYTKPGNCEKSVVMYIHGGGFTSGSAKARRNLGFYITNKLGYNVFSIDYRLAPENPFPAAPQDCFAAYKAALKRYAGKKIVLMGESAGGNLVLVTALMAKDAGITMPCAVVAFSPVTQFDKQLKSYETNKNTDYIAVENGNEVAAHTYFAGCRSEMTNPYATPLYGNLIGFPPCYIVASTIEVLRDDSILFDQKLRESGVESKLVLVPNMMHAFIMVPDFPESKAELRNVKKFIDEKIG